MADLIKDIFPPAVAILTIVAVVYIILLPFIAAWKLFKKVGIEGWKALIPVYNVYLIFKIAGMNGFLCIPVVIINAYNLTYQYINIPNNIKFFILIIGVIAFIINIFRGIKLSESFGKGTGFTVGMVLLPEIFEIILGMGKAKYQGSYKPKESK